MVMSLPSSSENRNSRILPLGAAVLAFSTAAFGVDVVPLPGLFPDGEASLADEKLWGGSFKSPTDSYWLYVGDDFRYFLDGSDTTRTNEIVFGSTGFQDRSATKIPQHLTLDIFNGGILRTGTFTSQSSVEGSTHTIKVHDAGMLAVRSLTVNSGVSRIELADGGQLNVTDGVFNYGSTTAGKPLDASLQMTDARLAIQSGGFSNWGRENNWTSIRLSVGVTNSVVENAGGFIFSDDSDFCFSNVQFNVQGEVRFDAGTRFLATDLVATNAPGRTLSVWSLARRAQDRDSELILNGRSHVQPIGIAVGCNASLTGRIVVAGRSVLDLTIPSFSYDWTKVGVNGVGFLEIADQGRFCSTSTANGGVPMLFGVSEGSFGELRLTGGTYEYYGAGTHIGRAGSGLLDMRDGLVLARRLVVGLLASSTARSGIRQTGGTIRLMSEDGLISSDNGVINLSYAEHATEAFFGGGVAEFAILTSANPSLASVVVDGGTFKRVSADWTSTGATYDKTFIRDIGSFTVGAKGLTIDSSGFDIAVNQNLASVDGAAGVLRKTGLGTLTLKNTAYGLTKTVVSEGALLLGDAASVLPTELVITNGATFSLVGAATGVTLRSLVVTDGTLALDPGDRIVVDGPVALSRLKVVFSTLPTTDEEVSFLEVTGALDEPTRTALRKVSFLNALPDGTHPAFSAAYDEATGKTTVTLGVKTNRPLGETTVWAGTDGVWGESGNWNVGLPTAERIAAFTAAEVARTVTVGSGMVAGALSFSGADYVLDGDSPLSFPAARGSAVITVESGRQTLSVPLAADSVVETAVSSGAALTVEKGIAGGGLIKTGKGRLTLGADNVFEQEVTIAGGTTDALTAGALGSDPDVDHTVNLADATLAFPEGDGTELSLDQRFVVRTASAKHATIVRNERDIAFENGLTPSVGVLVKRGKGRLTLKVEDGDVLTNSDGADRVGSDSAQVEFPEDGTPIDRLYGGMTVAEGPLLIKPAIAGTHPTVQMKNTLVCGIKVPKEGDVEPEFAFENVAVDALGKTFFLSLGCNAKDEYHYPVLRLVDAEMQLGQLKVGSWSYAAEGGPTLAMTNATIEAANLRLTTSNGVGSPVRIQVRDSFLMSRNDGQPIEINGAMAADFDHSVLGWTSGNSGLMQGGGQYTGPQTWTFRNGSEFGIGRFGNLLGNAHTRTFVFENSTWNVGDNDLTLDAAVIVPDSFTVVAAGETGLVLRVGASRVVTFADASLTGEGGFAKRGAGTVAFGVRRFLATGKVVAEEGVIDFTNAGVLEKVTIGGGAGTIRGATFHNATIALEAVDGAVPNFEDCVFTGRTQVTIGGDPVVREGVLVANCTGTLTGLETFSLRGWKDLSGVFTFADGQVKASIGHRGAVLVVR